MNTQIEILEITPELITVESGGQEIEVSRDAFERWIDLKGKRDYCNDMPNGSGEHIQQTGTISWDEYFQSHYLNADLAEFLTTRQPMTGKIKDMGALFEKLKKQII